MWVREEEQNDVDVTFDCLGDHQTGRCKSCPRQYLDHT